MPIEPGHLTFAGPDDGPLLLDQGSGNDLRLSAANQGDLHGIARFTGSDKHRQLRWIDQVLIVETMEHVVLFYASQLSRATRHHVVHKQPHSHRQA